MVVGTGRFLLPKKRISGHHLVLSGCPLEAGRSELVGGEGAGAGGEGDSHHHSLLAWAGKGVDSRQSLKTDGPQHHSPSHSSCYPTGRGNGLETSPTMCL